jgi:hypothetical protein
MHLLNVSDCLVATLGYPLKHCQEATQWQAWTIIERTATKTFDAIVALEVALLTNRLAKRGFEVTRVDDGQVSITDWLVRARVEPPRAVAPFAANGITLKDGLLVSAHRQINRLDPVSVAEQALGLDGPVKMEVAMLVAGSQVPTLFLTVPGNGRLKQPAVMFDEKRDSTRARSHCILHFVFDLGDGVPVRITPGFFVKHAAIAFLDRESERPGLEPRAVAELVDNGDGSR